MAWGEIPSWVTDGKRRRRKPPPPPVPYAPTAKGRKAAREAGAYDRSVHATGSVDAGSSGFDPVGAVTGTLSDALGSLGVSDPTGIYDTGSPARNLAEDEAKNLAEVAQRHYPAILGGDTGLAAVQQPVDEKSLRAAGAILAPVSGESGAAIRASEKAAQEAGAATRAAKAALGGGERTRGVVGKAIAKAEPDVVKGAREAAARRASNLPGGVKIAGKVAGRGVALPVKKPLTAPLALQTPAFIASGGDPNQFVKALEGKGTFATASSSLADVASHISPVLGEAVNLPATVLPSAFLVGKAGLSAGQGDSKELDALWKEYKKTGVLPAIAEGDLQAAKERFGDHPLFAALEASGAANVAGRLTGAGLRGLPGDVASLKREPQVIRGVGLERQRGYSRDAFRQVGQRLYDRSGRGQVEPGTHRARRIEKEAQNRFEAGSERVRKRQLADNMQVLNNLLPRKGPKVRVRGHVIGKIDRRTSEVVNLAVERLIQHPETFHADLEHYKAMVDAARAEKHSGGDYVLNRDQRRANKAISDQIAGALKVDSPHRVEATVKAANEFIQHQKADLEEMVHLGFLTPEQASKASLIPFARVHLGSDHGIPKDRQPIISDKQAAITRLESFREKAIHAGVEPATIDVMTAELHKAKRSHENAVEKHSQQIDQHGNALTDAQIAAEMQRRGIEPPGFLSHREATSGDFYKPSRGGGKLDSGTRTGASAASGAHVGGVEALVRQVARSTNLLHRAKTWNRAVTEFGIEVKGIDTAKEAQAVIAAPERYGLPHDTELVAVPRYPFGAKKAEREGAIAEQDPRVLEALEHSDPTQAGDVADKLLSDEIQKSIKGELSPDAQVALMPAKVAEQFLKGATPAPSYIRAVQAYTNLFKRAVLPFSPGFYIGNVFDNYMRTALAGINPFHFIVGHQVTKNLTEAQRAEAIPKAHFASVEGLAPHRSVESILKGADPFSKGIRRAAEWSRKHGWKQAAAKSLPRLLKQGTHYLLAINAFISEDLPQRGAIGKLALAEMSKTQGSWTKAIAHFNEIGQDFAKGLEDRSKMVEAQKYLEDIYGNYTNMSADARKLLGSITPFWTWMRAAYKFVYLTMPAHHSIATSILTGMARATQDEREQYGLDKQGDKPLPAYLQGALPWPNGGIVPFGNYNSFGYAADPLDALGRVVFPHLLGPIEAFKGIDWKGDSIEGEGDRLRAAAFAFAGSMLPLWNTLVHEESGKVHVGPSVNLPHVEGSGYVQYKREPTQTITVPKSSGGSSSGGVDYGAISTGSSSSVDYGAISTGGN